MPIWLSTAGKFGGIVTLIIALVTVIITLLKQVTALVAFLMFAIKAGLFLGFLSLIVVIGFLALRTWQQRRRENQS